MKIRFTLDAKFDAKLIERIKQRAGGGSTNEAAKFLLRFYHEQEMGNSWSHDGQNLPSECQDVTHDSDGQGVDLSGLDGLNLEF